MLYIATHSLTVLPSHRAITYSAINIPYISLSSHTLSCNARTLIPHWLAELSIIIKWSSE